MAKCCEGLRNNVEKIVKSTRLLFTFGVNPPRHYIEPYGGEAWLKTRCHGDLADQSIKLIMDKDFEEIIAREEGIDYK